MKTKRLQAFAAAAAVLAALYATGCSAVDPAPASSADPVPPNPFKAEAK